MYDLGFISHKPNRTKFRRKYNTDQAIGIQLDYRPARTASNFFGIDQLWQAGNQLRCVTLSPTKRHQKLPSSPSFSRFQLPTIRHWSPEPLHTDSDTIFSPTSDSPTSCSASPFTVAIHRANEAASPFATNSSSPYPKTVLRTIPSLPASAPARRFAHPPHNCPRHSTICVALNWNLRLSKARIRSLRVSCVLLQQGRTLPLLLQLHRPGHGACVCYSVLHLATARPVRSHRSCPAGRIYTHHGSAAMCNTPFITYHGNDCVLLGMTIPVLLRAFMVRVVESGQLPGCFVHSMGCPTRSSMVRGGKKSAG